MSEASYTAWDDNLYEWPPPDGWYQASDRKWWPEGTGPVEGEVSAATSPGSNVSPPADDSSFNPEKTSTLPAGGVGNPSSSAEALQTSSVPAGDKSAKTDSDNSDDDSDYDDLPSIDDVLPNIDDVFMSPDSDDSDDSSTSGTSPEDDFASTGETTTSSKPAGGTTADAATASTATASAAKPEEEVSTVAADETAEVKPPQPVGQAQAAWSNSSDFDPDATQIVDPNAAESTATAATVTEAATAAVQTPTTIGHDGNKPIQPTPENDTSSHVVEQSAQDLGWSSERAVAQPEAAQIPAEGQTDAVAKASPAGEQLTGESNQVATPRAPTASPQTVPSHSPNPSEHQVRSPAPVAPQPHAAPRADVNHGGMGGGPIGGAIGESVGFDPGPDYGRHASGDAHYQQHHVDRHQIPNPSDGSVGAETAHLNQFQNQGSVAPADGFGQVQEQADFHHNDYDNRGQGVDPQWNPNEHEHQYRTPSAQHAPEEVEAKSSSGRRGLLLLIGLLVIAALAALGFLAWNLINDGGTGIGDGGQSTDVEATGPGSIGEAYQPGTDVSVFYPDADSGEVRRWVVRVVDPVVDATERLVTGSGLNPPSDGEIYALLRINATYDSGPIPGDLGDLRFALVDPEGDVYTQSDAGCPAGQEGIDAAAQLDEGEAENGNLCWVVPAETLDRLVFGVEASDAVGRVHLQIQPTN